MDVEWLKARKRERKVTDEDLAAALGVERSVANKVANGKVAFNARRVDAVAKLLDVSRDELLFRAGLASEQPASPDIPPTRSADAGATVDIGKLDLSLSMGPGTLIGDYVEEETIAFDLALIRSITRSPPHRLKVVTGHGHSMEPTLQGSDMILIDTTERQLARQDGIYWIDLFGAAGLKRLRTVGKGRVEIISDNPAVGNQVVDADDLRIDGRAIWFARGL